MTELITDCGVFTIKQYSKFKYFTNMIEDCKDSQSAQTINLKILFPNKDICKIKNIIIDIDSINELELISCFDIIFILEYINLSEIVNKIVNYIVKFDQNYTDLIQNQKELINEIVYTKYDLDEFIIIHKKLINVLSKEDIYIQLSKHKQLKWNDIYRIYYNNPLFYLSKFIKTHYINDTNNEYSLLINITNSNLQNLIIVFNQYIKNIENLEIIEIINLDAIANIIRFFNSKYISILINEIFKIRDKLYKKYETKYISDLYLKFRININEYLLNYIDNNLNGKDYNFIYNVKFSILDEYLIQLPDYIPDIIQLLDRTSLLYKYILYRINKKLNNYSDFDILFDKYLPVNILIYFNYYSKSKSDYVYLKYLINKYNITLQSYLVNLKKHSYEHHDLHLFDNKEINTKLIFYKLNKNEIFHVLSVCKRNKIKLNLSHNEFIYLLNYKQYNVDILTYHYDIYQIHLLDVYLMMRKWHIIKIFLNKYSIEYVFNHDEDDEISSLTVKKTNINEEIYKILEEYSIPMF